MINDDDPVPLDACALPGAINVTSAALDLARNFQSVVPTGWIVVFSWHDGERIRASKDSPWEDKGPGMGLGAYRMSEIPQQAVWQAETLRYAVLIRQDVIENHPQKTIDLDQTGEVILK